MCLISVIPDNLHLKSAAETEDDERLHAAMQLPGCIREKRKAIEENEISLQECRARVVRLVECINEVRAGPSGFLA